MDNTYGNGKLVLAEPVALNTQNRTEIGGYWDLDEGQMNIDNQEWQFASQSATATGLVVRGSYSLTWRNDTALPQIVSSYHVRFHDAAENELARYVPERTFTVDAGASFVEVQDFEVTFASIEEANEVVRMPVFASFSAVEDYIASVTVSPLSLEGVPGERVRFSVIGQGLKQVEQIELTSRLSELVALNSIVQIRAPMNFIHLDPRKVDDLTFAWGSVVLGSNGIEGEQLLSEIEFLIPEETAAETIEINLVTVSVGPGPLDRTELSPNITVSIKVLPPRPDNSSALVDISKKELPVPLPGEEFDLPIIVMDLDQVSEADIRIQVDPPDAFDLGSTRFVSEHGGGTVNFGEAPGEMIGSLASQAPLTGDFTLGSFLLTPSANFDPGETSIQLLSISLGPSADIRDVVTANSTSQAVFAALEEGPVAIDFDLSTGNQGIREIGRIRKGDTITFQLHLAQSELVTGWGCVIDYDPSALQYQSQSFTPSDLIPSILSLVAEKTSSVELGGTTLGSVSEVRSGYLGEVAFEVLDGFTGETELEIAKVTLRLSAGGEFKSAVKHVVRVSSEDFGPLLLAGDFNFDGSVDFSDFFMFADAFGGPGGNAYDMNDDGEVDFSDFFLFADAFGTESRAKLLALAREHIGLPISAAVFQNEPNPFNSTTRIEYYAPISSGVQLAIFDLLGRRVRTLFDGYVTTGTHRIEWDGRDEHGRPVGSGVYLYRLDTSMGSASRRMTLLK